MDKRKHSAFLLGIVLFAFAIPSNVFAVGLSNDNYVGSLSGIKEFWILVQLDPDIEKVGLTKAQITKDVEAKIRTAGITIQSGTESLRTPGSPILCIAVGLLPSNKSGNYIYVTEVCVCQHAHLQRDSKIQINHVITWSVSSFGIAPESKIKVTIQNTITDLTDKFLNAYLTANPKQIETEPSHDSLAPLEK